MPSLFVCKTIITEKHFGWEFTKINLILAKFYEMCAYRRKMYLGENISVEKYCFSVFNEKISQSL